MMSPNIDVVTLDDLLPAERPAQRLEQISPDDIDFDDIGPDPTPDFKRSILQRGIQVPITVIDADGRYFLIAGRRRLKCAIEIGMETVPALIQTDVEADSALLTDHAQRHANPAAELASIERLLSRGYDEKKIAAATGMTVGTIRARLKLQSLNAELRDAFDDGKLSLAAAEQLVKLPVDVQTDLAIQYEETGELSVKDIRERRRVQRSQALDATPFDDLTALETTSAEPAQQSTASSLDQFIALVGANPTSARDLASVGIACFDTGRVEDVRDILQRIMELQA
jgi:ParB/RepB/Spo0J family partition protein